MLTLLEVLLIAANIPVLIWALLPFKRVPRFLDFMPLAAVAILILHLFIDNEPVPLRFIPLYIFTIAAFLFTISKIFKHSPNRPKLKVTAVIGRMFGIFALILCVMFPTAILPFHTLPEPTGEYDVGTLSSDLTDEKRFELYADESGVNRKLAVQFWYPTERTSDNVQYDIDGAPISAAKENYPVLIFSHGAFGVRMSNASAFRELASHGYIVASIDHTYHSFYTSFTDGTSTPVNMDFINSAIAVTNNDLSAKDSYEVTHEWLKLRTEDISFVIDSLKAGVPGAAGDMLNGHMDLSKIGLFGHSLGGAASAQVARERDDVTAAIVIDGTMIGDIIGLDDQNRDVISDEIFAKPMMQMYGSLYLNAEDAGASYAPNISAYSNSTSPAYWLCVRDSGHLNFTDLPRISPFLSGMLGIGTIDSLKCIEITNAYALAFFDEHLKGQSSPLLDGEAIDPAVVYEQRNTAVTGN